MNAHLLKITQSKRESRRNLAALPVAEKLRLLDAMRERAIAIRGATETAPIPAALSEKRSAYQAKTKK